MKRRSRRAGVPILRGGMRAARAGMALVQMLVIISMIV
jgi:hypothetical protein